MSRTEGSMSKHRFNVPVFWLTVSPLLDQFGSSILLDVLFNENHI